LWGGFSKSFLAVRPTILSFLDGVPSRRGGCSYRSAKKVLCPKKDLYELKTRDLFAIGEQIWKVKGKGILERECIDAETAASLPGTDDDGNPRDAQEGYFDVTPVLNVGEDI
jgi:hypothetical protein